MTDSYDASWTVMVYLAGDNNLTEEMVWALKEMKAWAIDPKKPKLNVVAQFDPSGMGIPTQRYDFQKPPSPAVLDGDLYDWRVPGVVPVETNTGNPGALTEFIVWGATTYPAAHYAVILSGHGSGTTEDFLMKDDNALDALSIDELQTALKGALQRIKKKPQQSKFDILGMDSCFMSMAEVSHALRDYVMIVVGAEGYEPESGWPYHRFLQAIKENTQYLKDGKTLAKMIVERYIRYYSDYDRTAGRSVDLAAVDLGKIGPLGAAVNGLGKILKTLIDEDAIGKVMPNTDQVVLAHWKAQTYKFDQFADLRDLCQCLLDRKEHLKTTAEKKAEKEGARKPGDKTHLGNQCQAVIDAVNDCVIGFGCAGFAYQHSHGLSIYFPWSVVSEDYRRNIKLGETTDWHLFLESYVNKTRRPNQEKFETEDQTQVGWGKERAKWERAVLWSFINVVKSAAGKEEDELAIGNMWKDRLKPDTDDTLDDNVKKARKSLLGQLAPFIGQLGGADAEHRYVRSRYVRSRYVRSRYAHERDRWVKNSPIGSGMRFEEEGAEVPELTLPANNG